MPDTVHDAITTFDERSESPKPLGGGVASSLIRPLCVPARTRVRKPPLSMDLDRNTYRTLSAGWAKVMLERKAHAPLRAEAAGHLADAGEFILVPTKSGFGNASMAGKLRFVARVARRRAAFTARQAMKSRRDTCIPKAPLWERETAALPRALLPGRAARRRHLPPAAARESRFRQRK